ncbi:uncharacterized protein TRAVEDRAFT_56051 [Trametes versicolor FP-101664 SS1]|uniref:uncharacterized protein n=1 Tax=Trametes versicolor (strain FP-101664) TaxID=717944 RepID=UPI000462247B|nr:uncharacterized protein TRAVEDRAFT_56051 [Trametes versicolor FP-101664 SS1]EIW62705.1 hypothetical protein TRAVEDRAFT_56051 [Trametes versicolor FP-101664 SS1]
MSALVQSPPPLLGDAAGNFRVHIVGNSGTGKSTLGAELAAVLNLPFISLDTLYWGPNWREATRDEFCAKVRAALDQTPHGWVIDGNYTNKLGGLITDAATDIIWLDPPLLLYFPRLCWRTAIRLFRLAPPCSPGCEERAREVFFSRDSIIWWCLSNHSVIRKRYAEPFRVDGVLAGGKHRRIGGWGGELAAWKRDVQAMMAAGAPALPLAAVP